MGVPKAPKLRGECHHQIDLCPSTIQESPIPRINVPSQHKTVSQPQMRATPDVTHTAHPIDAGTQHIVLPPSLPLQSELPPSAPCPDAPHLIYPPAERSITTIELVCAPKSTAVEKRGAASNTPDAQPTIMSVPDKMVNTTTPACSEAPQELSHHPTL